MRRYIRLVALFTALFLILLSTFAYADVGNHNSYDSGSSGFDFDFDSDSGSGDLASLIKFIIIFIRSPWYVKLLIIGAIVWMVAAEKAKNKKMRKKYVLCDKNFINTLDTTENELIEIARKKVTEKFGAKKKLEYIEIAGYKEEADTHTISYLIKLHEAFQYYMLVLSHKAIESGRYDEEGFQLVSLNKLKK